RITHDNKRPQLLQRLRADAADAAEVVHRLKSHRLSSVHDSLSQCWANARELPQLFLGGPIDVERRGKFRGFVCTCWAVRRRFTRSWRRSSKAYSQHARIRLLITVIRTHDTNERSQSLQSYSTNAANFSQFFHAAEAVVLVAIGQDVPCQVLADPWQLKQLTSVRMVQIDLDRAIKLFQLCWPRAATKGTV